MKAKYIGAIIGVLAPTYAWISASIKASCLYPFWQMLNVGGPSCTVWNLISNNVFVFLVVWGISTLLGFLLGSLIGWLIGRKK